MSKMVTLASITAFDNVNILKKAVNKVTGIAVETMQSGTITGYGNSKHSVDIKINEGIGFVQHTNQKTKAKQYVLKGDIHLKYNPELKSLLSRIKADSAEDFNSMISTEYTRLTVEDKIQKAGLNITSTNKTVHKDRQCIELTVGR